MTEVTDRAVQDGDTVKTKLITYLIIKIFAKMFLIIKII
jgi:hypothetical protein